MAYKILLSVPKDCKTIANYTTPVEYCGDIPHPVYLPKYNAEYAGLILCGGQDVHPKFYGEEINGSVDCNPDQDAYELDLIQAFIDAGKPILGICRGHQILNVYFNGTLYQDLENKALHRSQTDVTAIHSAIAAPNTIAQKLYGDSFQVNSIHHQAVKQLGAGLLINTIGCDVIEGFEHKNLPVFGVQWHPERICLDKAVTTADGIKVFQHFRQLYSGL